MRHTRRQRFHPVHVQQRRRRDAAGEGMFFAGEVELQLVGLRQQGGGARTQAFAVQVQPQRAAVAIEQRDLQLFFQALEGFRQRA